MVSQEEIQKISSDFQPGVPCGEGGWIAQDWKVVRLIDRTTGLPWKGIRAKTFTVASAISGLTSFIEATTDKDGDAVFTERESGCFTKQLGFPIKVVTLSHPKGAFIKLPGQTPEKEVEVDVPSHTWPPPTFEISVFDPATFKEVSPTSVLYPATGHILRSIIVSPSTTPPLTEDDKLKWHNGLLTPVFEVPAGSTVSIKALIEQVAPTLTTLESRVNYFITDLKADRELLRNIRPPKDGDLFPIELSIKVDSEMKLRIGVRLENESVRSGLTGEVLSWQLTAPQLSLDFILRPVGALPAPAPTPPTPEMPAPKVPAKVEKKPKGIDLGTIALVGGALAALIGGFLILRRRKKE